MNVLGIHLLLELRQCNPALLNDMDHIRASLIAAAESVDAHVVGESFHRFNPQGVTGILAIAESHISIHTWPEYSYAAADVFTCGSSFHPQIIADLLIEKLECLDPYIHEIQRGMIPQTVTT